MEYKTKDFIDVIYLKNQLITATTNTLCHEYEQKDRYASFLDTVEIMLDIENAFLLLDEKFF